MRPTARAFTLIELLIVVAIIAILAAIAVPNFLEAQTRSKVARSSADMRTIATAMESYIVDYNNEPRTLFSTTLNGQRHTVAGCPNGAYSSWWGFVSNLLTTPVSYITSKPVMPFYDETVINFWKGVGGTQGNQTYTTIRNTSTPGGWVVGQQYGGNAPPAVVRTPIPQQWSDDVSSAAYIIYTGGPDSVDSTVWGNPQYYDPSNGTISFGDVYRFGGGGNKDRTSDLCD